MNGQYKLSEFLRNCIQICADIKKMIFQGVQQQQKQKYKKGFEYQMNLRDHSQLKAKNMIEYDEQEQQKHMQSRSRRFWVKMDRRYFREIGVKELVQIRERIDRQVDVKEVPLSLQQGYYHQSNKISNQLSYFHRNIYPGNSKLFQRKAIRVLYQNSAQSQQQYGDSICIAYVFGFKYQPQDNLQQQKKHSKQYDEYYVIDVDDEENVDIKDWSKDRSEEKQRYRQVNKYSYNNSGRLQYSGIEDRIIAEQQSQQSTLTANQLTVTYWKQPNYQTRGLKMSSQQIDYLANALQLTPNKSSSDINFLTQCNYYDLAKANLYPTQIDREISLWSYEFDKVAALNLQTWNIISNNLLREKSTQRVNNTKWKKISNDYCVFDENTRSEKQTIQQQVVYIHEFLAWQHNLVNFKNGFADKNEQMLAQALQGMWIKQHKTKNMGDKKRFFKSGIENLMQTKSQLSNIFETDCKICFSTYVSEKNKVIYCDQCNQSFHQKCYGIVDLNEDPNSKFYCDACQYKIEINKKNQHEPVCQICYIPFSTLKRFGNAFFHPLCLFLNNLLKPNRGQLKLQDNTTSQTIIKQVKQHEICSEDNSCEFCTQTCNKGLRFKCSQPSCSRYFHMICAYLHSNVFNIWRIKQRLQVQIRCWHHFPGRDHLRQTYLRRFFCNHKNIADLSQNEFIEIYNEQLDSIREYKLELKSNSTSLQHCDMQTNRNCKYNSDQNSIKGQKSEQKKARRKYKSRQKSTKSQVQASNLIDLNSDDQQNTDYHNNSPQTLIHKTSTQYKQNQNQLQIQQQKTIKNSQYLRHSMARLEKDLIKKKRKTIQVRNSSSMQLVGMSKFLSQIHDTFGPEFNPFNQQSALTPYDINAEDSFEQNVIYQ